MDFLWTLSLLGLPILGSYWLARYAMGQGRGLAALLASLTLAWAWVTTGVTIAGSFGFLNRPTLLVWSAVVSLIGLKFRIAGQPHLGTRRGSGYLLESEALMAVGLSIWAAVHLALPSFVFPVKVVSDGPIYHLYFAARWWKSESLAMIPIPFGENAATYFPAVGDLWFTWLMTAWSGDRLARVGQAPFLIWAALACFATCRRLGSRTSAALIATCWFATSTPFLIFSFEPNVDTIFVAGYLTACFFFLRYALGDDGVPALILGSLAAGGAWGTKATSTVFVPPLLALMLPVIFARQSWSRRGVRHAVLLLTCPLVMAGFWFSRNLWLTGNPLYPLQIEVFGRTILTGWYDSEVMKLSQYYLPRDDWRAFLDMVLAVLDPRLATIWFLALFGGWTIGAGSRPEDRWVWIFAFLAILNVALYWLLIPYRTQQRFMFHAIGLAAIPLARLLDRGQLLRLAGVGLLGLHLMSSQGWPFGETDAELPWDQSSFVPNAVPGVIPTPRFRSETLALEGLGLLILGSVWSWSRLARGRTLARWLMASVTTIGAMSLVGYTYLPYLSSSDRLTEWSYPRFPDFLRGWMILDQRSGPQGTRVAYAGTNIPYYLMGVGMRNDVRYVNVDEHADWLMHDYHLAGIREGRPNCPYPRADWDRLRPRYESWLENLRRAGIQLLVVTRVNPAEGPHNAYDSENFPIERTWADTHPESFEPLYGVVERDPWFRIYRLRDENSG